jgi:hypothetical protein
MPRAPAPLTYAKGDKVFVRVGNDFVPAEVVDYEPGSPPRIIEHPGKVTVRTAARGKTITRTEESVRRA